MFKILSNLLTNTYTMSTKKTSDFVFVNVSTKCSPSKFMWKWKWFQVFSSLYISDSSGPKFKRKVSFEILVKVSWSLSIMRWKLVKIYKIFRSISHYKSFLLKSSVIFKYLIIQIFAWPDCWYWFTPATAHSHKSEF